jgi:hypothetical protein
MEKLEEVWETLVTCHTHPEKYTSKTVEPIVKFKRYKAPPQTFRYQGILLLAEGCHDRSQRGPVAPHKLINNQTLPGIMSQMSPGNRKQWAKERPLWIQDNIEEAFWKFLDQKWRNSIL